MKLADRISLLPAPAPAPKPEVMQMSSSGKGVLFIWVNLFVLFVVVTAMALHHDAQIGQVVYIIVLSMICTLPLIFMKTYRGTLFLMIIFLAYYFASFALKDIIDLLLAKNTRALTSSGAFFTDGEWAIVTGAVLFTVAYGAVCVIFLDRDTKVLARDWLPGSRVILGVLFWSIGFVITLAWQLSAADTFSGVKVSSNPYIGLIIMFRILQPLGTLILIYHYLVSKNRWALAILIITMLADFVMGFVGDSKELAVRDLLLYLVSMVLLRERIPLYQTMVFVLIAGISFSFFAAYRLAVHSKHESRIEALKNINKHVGAISSRGNSMSKRFFDGLEYFADRITLKSSVEQIVSRSGVDIAFQQGRTIEPLLYIFIPRVLWRDKPNSSMAGQVFNQEFKISASKNTYISTSQVGELYWNYGWTGLVTGMLLIGAVMGTIATSMRLDKTTTLPRFLFILMTVYLLSLRFETAIAEVYSVWARAVLLLFIMNMLIPKVKEIVLAKHAEKPLGYQHNYRLANTCGIETAK